MIKRRMSLPWIAAVFAVFSLLTAGRAPGADAPPDFSGIPAQGVVTMVDLGAKKCIPCKMMAPILEKMKKAYAGKAAIVFIDVWQHREQAARFNVRTIPTQIFFDASGKEASRHVGFMSEQKIIETLKKMGVEL